MKKRYAFPIVVIFVTFLYYLNLPDYQFCNSQIHYSDNLKTTDLNAIIYDYFQTDDTISELMETHNTMNGLSNELVLHLYYSKFHMWIDAPFRTIIYN